ncbi:SDR family NAD(P)-dependent oxidoreductase [Pigmentiphaga sp. YJ18]|uniref:SDR family NAD(P)-dependent oxidoreductase n=1 Tax=Pigmentiphaga sp. YJ18 TaxID=3134907 RepID=UPI00405468C2
MKQRRNSVTVPFEHSFSPDTRVLVTGGTSGIGRAIAAAYAAGGARVTATGATRHEVERANGAADLALVDCVVLDVRDAQAVQRFAARFQNLDVLVNCAGVIRRGAELTDPAVFADVVDINLNGTMRMCSALRPALAARRGTIVNTTSILSVFGGAQVPGYSASKGGVAQLTKSLAIAYAADGIRVNAIAPGFVQTPMVQDMTDNAERSRAIEARTPLKRWGQPQDMIGPVMFLASPAAAFVTGVVLPVDGGYLVMSSDAAG